MAKRKTPPALAKVIMHLQPEIIAHCEEMLRVKRTFAPENRADHVRNRTEGEMVAFVNGYNACLEATMHAFRCYAGFHNYGPVHTQQPGTAHHAVCRSAVAPDHPDYLEWRKLYYTNGIAKT